MGQATADSSERDFFGLSLADLAYARGLFHVQLLDYPNVIGTALGRYLIRVLQRSLEHRL